MVYIYILEILFLSLYALALMYYVHTFIFSRYNIMKMSINSIANSMEKYEELSAEELSENLEMIYEEMRNDVSRFSKYFPDIITWMKAVRGKMEIRKNLPPEIVKNNGLLKLRDAYKCLANKYPYEDLNQIQKIIVLEVSDKSNDKNSQLTRRLYEEFLNQNKIEKKIRRQEFFSVIIGITGILEKVWVSGTIKFL